MRRPIVATDVPGCREIVSDEDNGLLVPPRSWPRAGRAAVWLAAAERPLCGLPGLRWLGDHTLVVLRRR